MGLRFLWPQVWWLAFAVAVPIGIHLLTRAVGRPVIFPSVRFLEPTPLSAVSRRAIEDWPLLLLRTAVVLLAVAALAGPVVVTPARQAAWNARLARAVVLDDRTAPPEDELRAAAVGATFARTRVRDAVTDAVRWLERQTPAAREIVVLSAFRRGATGPADFVGVPPHIGIRLVRTADGSRVRTREIARLGWQNGRAVRVTETLLLSSEASEVRETRVEPLADLPIRVTAAPEEQAMADAALRAVLRRGLRLPPAGLMDTLAVDWPGDVERLAATLEARLTVSLDAWEPETLDDAELAALTRAPRPLQDALPEDAGDRRVAWALVVALLVGELWMRRGAAWT